MGRMWVFAAVFWGADSPQECLGVGGMGGDSTVLG